MKMIILIKPSAKEGDERIICQAHKSQVGHISLRIKNHPCSRYMNLMKKGAYQENLAHSLKTYPM